MGKKVFMPELGDYVTIKPVAPTTFLLDSKYKKVGIQVATDRENDDGDIILTFCGWGAAHCVLWSGAK